MTTAVPSLAGRAVGQVGSWFRSRRGARPLLVPVGARALGRLRLRARDAGELDVSRRAGTLLHADRLAGSAPQVELIEPVEGPSIYHDWLESHPHGVHHLAVYVESLDAAIASMAAAGYALLQSGAGYGLDGDGGYAYFDTEHDFGVVLEAIEVLAGREPDFTWP